MQEKNLPLVAIAILCTCLFIAYQIVGNFEAKQLNADLIKKNKVQEDAIWRLEVGNDSLKHELELFEDSVNVYQNRLYDLQQDARKLKQDYADKKKAHEREVATLIRLHETERQLILSQKSKIIYEN